MQYAREIVNYVTLSLESHFAYVATDLCDIKVLLLYDERTQKPRSFTKKQF